MASFLNPLTSLLGAGANIFGMFQQQKQQDWQNGLTMEQFNRRNGAQDRGVESWNASSDLARDSSIQLRDLFMSALQGDGGSQQQLSQILQQYPEVMNSLVGGGADPFSRGTSGTMQSLMGQNDERRGAYTQPADTAFAGFQGGGWTPGRQNTQDRYMDMLNGQGSEMGNLSDVGGSLLGGRGQTAMTQGFQDRGMDALNRGGMNDQLQRAWAGSGALLDPEGATDTLDSLQSGGLDLFGSRGMTPEISSLFQRGLQGLTGGALGTDGLTAAGGQAELRGLQDLEEGGRTDISDGLGGRGLDLANREALLPLEQAFQIAREDASRNTEGAFKRAQRAAQARKGGSASVVAAGGAEGDPMTEWADQASRSVSDAGRQALMGQQNLQLQQQGQGASMAGTAGGLENNRYAAASDLVKGMEGNATQRYQANAGIAGNAISNALGFTNTGAQTALGGQGQETDRFLQALQLLPQISNAAATQMNSYGQNALGAGGLENSRMNTGLGSLQAFNQNRLGAGGLMNQSMTDQGQYALGQGQLGMGLENSFQQAGNNLFGQSLAAGQFGAGLNQQQLQAFQQYFNNTQGVNRDNTQGAQTGVQNLFNLGGQGLQYALGGMGGGTYAPAQNAQSPWAGIGQALSGVNFTGLFGTGNGKNTGGYNQFDPLAGSWQGNK